MKARFVIDFPCIGIHTYETDVFNAIERAKELGFDHVGYNENPRQREELQDQPIFDGLQGPMWDGDAIRYESCAVYRKLSC